MLRLLLVVCVAIVPATSFMVAPVPRPQLATALKSPATCMPPSARAPTGRSPTPSANLASGVLARRASLSFAVTVVAAISSMLSRAISRRLRNSALLVEAAKVECSTTGDEDVCEAVYSKDWGVADKLLDDKLRLQLSSRARVLDW